MKQRATLGALSALLLFLLLTAALRLVDVAPIGPMQTSVGLASLNGFIHARIGFQPFWLLLSEALGLLALAVGAGFGLIGLAQLVRRRSLRGVDPALLRLGALYAVTLAVYLLFERIVVNLRPVLLAGEAFPEASYPSSHTVLALSILGGGIAFVDVRPGRHPQLIQGLMAGLLTLIVVGRLLSGVHWLTDIVGGLLLGAALVLFYVASVREER